MKVAIVHDWLVSYRGGEKVLEAIAEEYPEAPIYTLFYDPSSMPDSLNGRDIRYPKLLNRFKKIRKLLLPLLPIYVESLPLLKYDLIISSSSCVAKGVIPSPAAKHICYLHSPMRYIWDQRDAYFQGLSKIPGAEFLINLASKQLRIWDVVSASRVDQFIANSNFVKQRVAKYYGKDSTVIHPPINLDFFQPPKNQYKGMPYVLAAGAFVSYKRFDLVIDACEHLGQRLIVAGSGPFEQDLRQRAKQYTEFQISPKDQHWRSLLQNASALIFPGTEDFGMIAIEAMACGTPVIAYKNGGALDFITKESGYFIEEQTVEGVITAIEAFEQYHFDKESISRYAKTFDRQHFKKKFLQEVLKLEEQASIVS